MIPWRTVHRVSLCESFFFFQAEDGIRDIGVTGVQTCALPISPHPLDDHAALHAGVDRDLLEGLLQGAGHDAGAGGLVARSEERRVGKECRSRWSPYH